MSYSDTPRYDIQYPDSSAATNVPNDLKTPLDTIDSIITPTYSGTTGSRPTAGTFTAPSASGTTGRHYYDTTTGLISVDTGAAWVALGPVNTVDVTITQSTPGASAIAGSTGFSADAGHTHAREAWGGNSDFQPNAAAGAAGSTGRVADAGHVHPGLPVGIAFPWFTATPPSGFLALLGQAVSQTTYPLLYALLGTLWNTGGEGAGNFRLPNCTDRALVGAGGLFTIPSYYGASSVTLTTAELPSHTHTITDQTHYHTGTTDSTGIPHDHSTPTDGAVQAPSSTLNLVTLGGTGVWFSAQLTGPANPPTDHTHTFTTNGSQTGITATNATGNGSAVSLIQPVTPCLWITRAA